MSGVITMMVSKHREVEHAIGGAVKADLGAAAQVLEDHHVGAQDDGRENRRNAQRRGHPADVAQQFAVRPHVRLHDREHHPQRDAGINDIGDDDAGADLRDRHAWHEPHRQRQEQLRNPEYHVRPRRQPRLAVDLKNRLEKACGEGRQANRHDEQGSVQVSGQREDNAACTDHDDQCYRQSHEQKVAEVGGTGFSVLCEPAGEHGGGAEFGERHRDGAECKHVAELAKIRRAHGARDHDHQHDVRADRKQAGEPLRDNVDGELASNGHTGQCRQGVSASRCRTWVSAESQSRAECPIRPARATQPLSHLGADVVAPSEPRTSCTGGLCTSAMTHGLNAVP